MGEGPTPGGCRVRVDGTRPRRGERRRRSLGVARHPSGRLSASSRSPRPPGPRPRDGERDRRDRSLRAFDASVPQDRCTDVRGRPDPRWTPEVLDVLREHSVPATFFLVGREVVQHPELARREVREGHEPGLLSFNHVDPGSLSTEQMARELRLTQAAIVGATGQRSAIFRPSYVGSALLAGKRDLRTFRRASQLGYLAVLTDVDSRDWRRDGAAALVHRAIPHNGAGGILTFRDGGGDRRSTVGGARRCHRATPERGVPLRHGVGARPGALCGRPGPTAAPPAGAGVSRLPARGELADAHPRGRDRHRHGVGGRTDPRALVVRLAPVSAGAAGSTTAPTPRTGAPASGDSDRSRAQRGGIDRTDSPCPARLDTPAVRGHRRRRRLRRRDRGCRAFHRRRSAVGAVPQLAGEGRGHEHRVCSEPVTASSSPSTQTRSFSGPRSSGSPWPFAIPTLAPRAAS